MKLKFERIVWSNRWLQKKHHRNGDWTIIGISKRYFSSTEFEYQISFFGLMARIWLKKIIA